jgi:hypothetical protein
MLNNSLSLLVKLLLFLCVIAVLRTILVLRQKISFGRKRRVCRAPANPPAGGEVGGALFAVMVLILLYAGALVVQV